MTTYNTGFQSDLKAFYGNVMKWLMFALGAATISTLAIGPLVPTSFISPLSIVLIVGMLALAFTRMWMKYSDLLTIVIPSMLGVIIYPVLENMTATGNGGIIVMALAGTTVVFGGAAWLGWKSEKNYQHWLPKMFLILVGLIVVSLLNAFIFQLPFISLAISWGVLILFSIYSFIDVNAIRKRSYGDAKPSFYALNVFLDIFNIFSALLNIFR